MPTLKINHYFAYLIEDEYRIISDILPDIYG
jgi:hypothetical protein